MSPYLKIRKGGTSPGGGQADAEAEGAGPFPGAGPRVSDTTGREVGSQNVCVTNVIVSFLSIKIFQQNEMSEPLAKYFSDTNHFDFCP